MTETGGSDGEAIPAPDVGGAGGSRAQQGGDAGSAIIASRFCCEDRSAGSRSRLNCKREQQLDSLCLIGQGSAALVYLVRCRSTGRLSALKVQRKADHARSVERVQMEREVMVDARHPLVTPLYAAFQDRLYLYLDMEYCPGGSLDNFVRYCVKRNLTEDEARFYAAEITIGLEFLHSKGYVYRDLKAANVLVAASGHIKLTDFGIAERGKVRVETEDKVVSPPPPLPRTQSSPVFSEVPVAHGVIATGHQRRQTYPEGAPQSRNQVSPPSSCATTTRVRVTKKASGGHSMLFHRRQQNASSGTTTPHLAGLGARICDRFTRARDSVSTRFVSGSKLSSLEGSAADTSPGMQRKTSETREGMGAPVPLFRGRPNESPREGERKQGLPPSYPGVVPLDRSGNPCSNGLQPVARQTSVALAESSWGVLSGSPEYMAPEVLMHDSQGSAVDWWGMGILTYELLFGRTPFAGEGGKTRLTYLNIMNKEVQFPEGGPRDEGEVTEVCKDFVQALLTKDPRGRAGSRGAHVVKAHPFFRGVSWDHLLEQEAPLVPRLLGTRCCVRPPPVENTSGWWWDVEDGVVDVKEEHRSRQGQGKQDNVWLPFDNFNWVNDAAVRVRSMDVTSEFEERCGACGKKGNVPLGNDGVDATTAASRA